MIVAFTMQAGRRTHSITRTYRKKVDIAKARAAIDNGPFQYKWPDGTETRVTVTQIDGRVARDIRSRGDNLRGYEWMADTIISHGRPMRAKDISQETAYASVP